ncbi:MAG: CoA transferase [Gemmatimonadetes bacterium]|nr:CoA transferase [Gemmatimonadota bacterium]
MDGILKGVLVISLEQAVAAPFASWKLAAAGARVIKIERPEGDFAREYDHVVHGESAYFVWLNRGKESIVLNIKDPGDAAVLRRMIARADIFVHNLAPGAAERAGFGTEELRRAHPRLITCEIIGYGKTGPYARMKAYDNLLQGETGLLSVTGYPDAPAKVGISIVDIGAGLHAYAAMLEALMARERTGTGCGITISLFDCLADWMTVPYLHQVYGGRAPVRSGLHHASIAPYGPYPTGDGRQVLISIQNDREWVRFCESVLCCSEMVRDPRFADNDRRVANRGALNEAVDQVFLALSMEEVVDRLQAADIAFGRLNTVEDLARHPQLRLSTIDTPGGPVELPVTPVPVWGADRNGRQRVPSVGEHSDTIRSEFA